jgi:hypothetical protein
MKPLHYLVLLYILGIGEILSPKATYGQIHTKDFNIFLRKFKILALPVEIKPLPNPPKELSVTAAKSIDTEFIGTNAGYWVCYGVLPDTSNYFHLIWLVPTELYIPILTTFTKTGRMISQQDLSIGDCASGPCGYVCEVSALIKKDYTIYLSDTITINKCDDNGGVIPGTASSKVLYRIGKKVQNGTIEFEKQSEKDLKK